MTLDKEALAKAYIAYDGIGAQPESYMAACIERAILAYLSALPRSGGEAWMKEAAHQIYECAVHYELTEEIILRNIARHAPVSAVPDGWQTIESAPKNGIALILARFDGGSLSWASKGYWHPKWKNWNDGIEPAGLASPTHWMHVPPLNEFGVEA